MNSQNRTYEMIDNYVADLSTHSFRPRSSNSTQARRRHSPYSYHNDIVTLDNSSESESEDTKLARKIQEQCDMEYAQQLQRELSNQQRQQREQYHVRSNSPDESSNNFTINLFGSRSQQQERSLSNAPFRHNRLVQAQILDQNRLGIRPRGGSHSHASRHFAYSDRDFTSDDYEELLRLDEKHSNKKGLCASDLQALPCFQFNGSTSNDENDKTCSICYDEYKTRDQLMALTCMHKFHKNCISQWLKDNRKCPLCQKDAVKGN